MRNFRLTFFSFLLALPLLFVSCNKEEETTSPDAITNLKSSGTVCNQSAVLWAGQNIEIGTVDVVDNGTSLDITYVITGDYRITEAHLYVGPEKDIPATKKGNPKIGNFPYSNTTGVFQIQKKSSWGNNFVIAAHAAVVYDPLKAFENALPATATLNPAWPGGNSYFNSTLTNAGILNGTWDGYCIDTDHLINPGNNYQVNVFSSYETLPTNISIDYPQNLDLINWLINQNFFGQISPGGFGTYTYGDIQRAIWEIIDANPYQTLGLGSWSQNRVNEIKAASFANGEGYVPSCGDQIAVVLQPVTGQQVTIAQVTFSSVINNCTPSEETAWGKGSNFQSFTASPYYGGNNWGWYFANCTATSPLPW